MTALTFDRLLARLGGQTTRRTAVLGAAAGVAAHGLRLTPRQVAARQTNDLASGGLGLSPNSFAEMYGAGEVGQGALIYEVDNEVYAVVSHPEVDLVTSICWFARGEDTVSQETGFTLIEQFLPTDARLREVYTTPAAGIGPFAIVEIYKSAGLAEAVAGQPTIVTSGTFMIAYQIGGGFDLDVRAVNAFIGDRARD